MPRIGQTVLFSSRMRRTIQSSISEQAERSICIDGALKETAERRLAEQAVERGEIDLAKRRVLLVAGTVFLALLLIVFVTGVVAVFVDPTIEPALMSIGGGGSLVALLVAWIRWG